MKKAVHFGAGNIGRGFIGLLLSKAGYHVTFIDIIDELVDDINRLGKYNVQIAGSPDKITVENISAIDSDRDDVGGYCYDGDWSQFAEIYRVESGWRLDETPRCEQKAAERYRLRKYVRQFDGAEKFRLRETD